MRDPGVLDPPVHLIGIGGAGMSAIAKVLLARGVAVSGSDIKASGDLEALRALGAEIAVGHRPENLGGAHTVIVSSAIRETNSELSAARARGLPVHHRAQVLGHLMRGRRGIAVSGTHGKTTTTSMIALALQRAGLDPTFLIGGDLNETGTNAHHGTGDWFVTEADESDGSFLWLTPEIAVITNIEADHLDHYRDLDEIRDTFAAFLGGVRPGGAAVVCADDEHAAALAERSPVRAVTYGLGSGEWGGTVVERGAFGQRVVVRRDGTEVADLRLPVDGLHNVRNALAALAVADLAGVVPGIAAEALATFAGVRRRFEVRGLARGVTVIDDYAHHPTEVRATLEVARERGFGRVFAVFQPHLYSRTAALGRALGESLASADVVVVTDVYAAREDPAPGVTGKIVVDGVLDAAPRARVAYLPKRGEIVGYVTARARTGDAVVTIGAGDVTALAGEILASLSGRGGRETG